MMSSIRLDSINAKLDGENIVFNNGYSMWLVTYLAGAPSHSTEDSFKIGKVMKEYGYSHKEVEEEAMLRGFPENSVPVITGDYDTDALLEDERIAQEDD